MAVASKAKIPTSQRMIVLEGYIEDITRVEGVVPASIVKGVIWQESKFDETSYRYNYDNPADRSYGLMHLTIPTAQEIWERAVVYTDLYEPMFNIWLGTSYLKKLYNRYGDWNKAIAAYNAGSPRYTAAGSFINQGYVNVVLKVANILGSYVTTLAKTL